MIDPQTASAQIDLAALAHNVRAVRDHVAPAQVMATVKADAYGHGLLECAAAAREAGADWLGVASMGEALALREAGDTGRILSWLHGPDEDFAPAVADEIDVTASSLDQLSSALMAAAICEKPARVQLELDSGMGRAGCSPADWEQLCSAAAECESTGGIKVTGVWTHLATADQPGSQVLNDQQQVFDRAVAQARAAGLEPEVVHLSNSAAALTQPELRHDLVRLGIAMYGIDPGGELIAMSGLDLQPVMRLRAQLVQVREVPKGAGVSYGHTWHAPQDTRLGLVPLGYGDGILRMAGNRVEVHVGGRRVPIVGRVCMDQFVVDLGPDASDTVGDDVILFGGDGPRAEDWAEACETIGYEIVTRIGTRVPRVHQGVEDE